MTTKVEKIRQAASDMGFDDHTDMLDFLDGVGLEVVEKEPSHETRRKLALKQARETFVHRAVATHPQKWKDIAPLGSHASDLHELRIVQALNEKLEAENERL
jgi:hypothetical protein